MFLCAVALFLLLQYAWEVAHAPLYDFGTSLPQPIFFLLCALGDLVLAAAGYAGVALAFGRPAWLVRPGWQGPALAWIFAGLGLTAVVEVRALKAGAWAYTEQMPEIAGIGLSPVLQWVVVPPAVVALSALLCRGNETLTP